MTSNAPTPDSPLSLALEYARWKGWRDKVYGRLHPSKRRRMVAWARLGLHYRGRMHYTEGPDRSQLFHRARGQYEGASADCSQYVSAVAHWSGVATVTDADWTGTLYRKGVEQSRPYPGCVVIFGMPPGVHVVVMVTDTACVGFGRQAAPDLNTLASLIAYFSGRGHVGYSVRDLTK